jgi:hypothetical protein
MRRGIGIAWVIGVLVIVALFAFTMRVRHAGPPASDIDPAPPAKNPPTPAVTTTTAPTTTTATTPSGASKPPRPRPPSDAIPPTVGAPAGGGSSYPTVAESPAGMPRFPWPPPRYSAFATIVREWVADASSPTLGSVARRLESAFERAGYGERSYYSVPGGFALVSRIEQIRADATPVEPPARWAIDSPQVRASFIDHIRALFNAPPGFYRVIVFAVTDQDFAADPRPPSSAEARGWASSGSLRLSAPLANLPYTQNHYTTALIYEFERRADRNEAEMRTPSNTPGQVHLERTGLWQALARR